MLAHKCPWCGVTLSGPAVTRPTVVRCPVTLVEADRVRYPDHVAYVCTRLGVKALPWRVRCGRLFTRYPSTL